MSFRPWDRQLRQPILLHTHDAVIERAHAEARRAGVVATDDAGLCERLGLPVRVVRGSERGLKVTEEADFGRAEALAALVE